MTDRIEIWGKQKYAAAAARKARLMVNFGPRISDRYPTRKRPKPLPRLKVIKSTAADSRAKPRDMPKTTDSVTMEIPADPWSVAMNHKTQKFFVRMLWLTVIEFSVSADKEASGSDLGSEIWICVGGEVNWTAAVAIIRVAAANTIFIGT